MDLTADPAPTPMPGLGMPPRQMFSDTMPASNAGETLIRATLGKMVDEDALAAWRLPVDAAIRKSFGDLDPEDPELADKFRLRAPGFLASLPGLLDQFDSRSFEEALQGALLAGFLNGSLPVSFWRHRGGAK